MPVGVPYSKLTWLLAIPSTWIVKQNLLIAAKIATRKYNRDHL